VLTVCEKATASAPCSTSFRTQNRGGKGIILIDASERNGPVVGLVLVEARRRDDAHHRWRGQMLRTSVRRESADRRKRARREES